MVVERKLIPGDKCVMDDELKIKMYSFTLDCINPHELAKFYAELLNWEVVPIDEEWACACPRGSSQGTYPGIMFQHNPEYKPPVWPEKPGAQQQMAHMDFAVNNLGNFLMGGKLCLTMPGTLFAYVK